MVLVEAQYFTKPVIAGDSGGTKETMLVGETERIVDATEPQNISHVIVDVFSDEQKLIEMRLRGESMNLTASSGKL
ncbi:MAG: phosphatidylinositol alpha-1,6-mannosyltransferase [Paraglaciecola sp.]|jgi:phosphatidylinositol alpha-1,6-mannosyltransferase